jgi:hypothetical protein
MFPDFSREHFNQWNQGKAFGVLIESTGIGVQKHTLTSDPEEWDDCLKCPDYRSCYDLSMAKLQLWREVQRFA